MRNVIFAAPFPLETTMRFARGAAALEGAEVATLRMRVESDVARQEVLLEHATAIESIEQKRKFVIQQAATREADTELHGMDQRERVAIARVLA